MKDQVYHDITVTKGDATITVRRPWFGFQDADEILSQVQKQVYKLYTGDMKS